MLEWQQCSCLLMHPVVPLLPLALPLQLPLLLSCCCLLHRLRIIRQTLRAHLLHICQGAV